MKPWSDKCTSSTSSLQASAESRSKDLLSKSTYDWSFTTIEDEEKLQYNENQDEKVHPVNEASYDAPIRGPAVFVRKAMLNMGPTFW